MRRRTLINNRGRVNSYVTATYVVDSLEYNPTFDLLGRGFDISQVKTMYINDVELDSPVCTYTFTREGEYTIKIVMNNDVTDTSEMFAKCACYSSFDFSHFDTSKVTNMMAMFAGAGSDIMTSLDLSNFDTSNVTNMSYMFNYNQVLTSLDVSSFNTSKVTDMSSMFSVCYGLTSIDVSNFDTSNVTNMSDMFGECRGLTSLDVSNFDTSKVTNMNYLFNGCNVLTSIDLSNFDTSNVTEMRMMFAYCTSLTDLTMMGDVSNVTDTEIMFENVTTNGTFHWNPDYYYFDIIDALPSTWKCDPGVITTTYSDSEYSVALLDNSSNVQAIWINKEKQDSVIDSAKLSSDSTVRIVMKDDVTDLSLMFYTCVDLATINLSHFDTSKVTSMSRMFDRCSDSLTTVDFSGCDLSSVTDMSSMFYTCLALTSVTMTGDVSNVTDLDGMFKDISTNSTITTNGEFHWNPDYNYFGIINVLPSTWKCYPGIIKAVHPTSRDSTQILSSTDNVQAVWVDNQKLSSVVTTYQFSADTYSHSVYFVMKDNVTSTSNLFMSCKNMTSVDLSHFDTNKVTDMSYMFSNCIGLTSLDLSTLDTSNVTDMSYMFASCLYMNVFDLYGWNLSKVSTMSYMFSNCTSLKSVYMDGDTSGIKDMSGMFFDCTSLVKWVLYNDKSRDTYPENYEDIFFNVETDGGVYFVVNGSPTDFFTHNVFPSTWDYIEITSRPEITE